MFVMSLARAGRVLHPKRAMYEHQSVTGAEKKASGCMGGIRIEATVLAHPCGLGICHAFAGHLVAVKFQAIQEAAVGGCTLPQHCPDASCEGGHTVPNNCLAAAYTNICQALQHTLHGTHRYLELEGQGVDCLVLWDAG